MLPDERRRPERPRQVIANPDEVGTGSKSSAIVRGVKGHDPVVMVCMAGHAVQLYVSIAVNRRVLVRCVVGRQGVNISCSHTI